MKKYLPLLVSVLFLFLFLNLPRFILIDSSNLGELQSKIQGWNYFGVAANYLIFFILLKYSKKSLIYFGVQFGKWKNNLIWFSIITFTILILFRLIDFISYGGLTLQIPPISTIIFQFIYVAIGEELFWRGYVQTEYGIGVASILFGLLHVLNIFSSDISWIAALVWGIYAIFLGFIMGMIRKKTDSIYASSLFHGLVNIFNYLIVPF